jgi:1-acyl-sn-glycerol-3-phosphate acyltransferase
MMDEQSMQRARRHAPRLADALVSTGSYRTAEDRRRPFPDRLLGRFDAWYYLKLGLSILEGRRLVDRNQFDNAAWCDCGLWIMRAAEDSGAMLDLSGYQHLSKSEGPVVFAANHMSVLETMGLPASLLLYKPVTTVVKESLLHYPVFGKIMQSLDPIAVARQNPRKDLVEVLQKGEERLREGISVVLFPQATRLDGFSAENFNTLGVKLAARAGVDLVPVAVKTDFQGVGRWLRDFGAIHRHKPIRFALGEAIRVDGNGKEAHRQCVDFISGTLRGWGVDVR